MKLIYLLVKELPNRGGWPAAAVEAMSFNHNPGVIHFFDEEGKKVIDAIKFDGYKAPYMDTVTTEQYEAAIASSKKSVWNGKGLPPIGCDCEAYDGLNWYPATVVAHCDGFAFAWNYDHAITFTSISVANFRPIQTEAERKREGFAKSLCDHLDDLTDWDSPVGKVHALAIYDAIASGKISGVKLD